MCGIVAGFNDLDNSLILNSIAELEKRGPDSKNFYIDKNVFLGHTLLSIFSNDTSSSIQPLYSFHKKWIACINGEIYNYEELKQILKKNNYDLYSKSDSEVLVNILELYGVNGLNKINGEFAFVAYNFEKQIWIAGVDEYGTKPLKYFHDEKNFYIGSTIKCLGNLGISLELDKKICLHSLSFQILPEEKTLFKNINNIPVGHYIVVNSKNQLSKHMYKTVNNYEFDYNLNVLSDLLEKAIINRVPKEKKLGLVLSGGLDSSLICHYLLKNKIPTEFYSIDFSLPGYSEKQNILNFCKSQKFKTNIILLDNAILSHHFKDAITNSENIAINPHVAAKLLINKRMKIDNIKVCLTGDGADEIFYGYPHFFSGTEFQFILDSSELGKKNLSLLNKNLDLNLEFKPLNSHKTSQKIYIDTWLNQYGVGMLGDSQSANIGQEHRYPFLDKKLVNYTNGIKDFKSLNYPSKQTLRDLVAKFDYTKSLVPKRPFAAPHLTVEYYPLFENYVLNNKKFNELNLYNTTAMENYVNLVKIGGNYSSVVLCQMLSIGILLNEICN